MTNEYLRQRDILTPDQLAGFDVDIVGAGALGGAVLLCLCKMGFGVRNRITITDFDACEPHNLPSQWFRHVHAALGEPKPDALAELVAWLCDDRQVTPVRDRFTGDEKRAVGPAIVIAVDSLTERRRIWERLKRRNDWRVLVDARMGSQVLEIYRVEADQPDRRLYEESLERPEEAFTEPCTEQAIMYTALGAAALVGSLLRACLRHEQRPEYIVFDFKNFLLDTRSRTGAA